MSKNNDRQGMTRKSYIRLPEKLDDRLRQYAEREDRTLSWVVRRALEQFLKRASA